MDSNEELFELFDDFFDVSTEMLFDAFQTEMHSRCIQNLNE